MQHDDMDRLELWGNRIAVAGVAMACLTMISVFNIVSRSDKGVSLSSAKSTVSAGPKVASNF